MEDDPAKKADILNAQFQSVFSPPVALSLKAMCDRVGGFVKPDGLPRNNPQMPRVNMTVEGVKKSLSRLKAHKGAGPDKISPLCSIRLVNTEFMWRNFYKEDCYVIKFNV